MRKWVLVGIGMIAAAGVIGYIFLRSNTPETQPIGVSPTPGSVRSDSIDPSPNESPEASPSPTPPSLDGPIVAGGGPQAATNLESQTGCREDEPGQGFVDLKWTPAVDRGQEQRLQVTIYREDFESGNFQLSEALSPDRVSYQWRPMGQARHYWRVLTRHSDGWIPSETARFAGPPCVAD